MKFAVKVLAVAFLLALTNTARAQEPELVSEIVARVNNDIVTSADYQDALRAFKDELTRQMQSQGKSQAEIDAEFEKLKGNVLDYLIEDLLLEQKAKELGIDVEADVNQRMLEIAKENGFDTILKFEEALKQQGIDPENARATLRKQLQQQYVIQREVIQPIFMRLNEKDRRDVYEKYKDKFTKPGEVTLSEIFLPLEGHTATEVEQRARRLVTELRAGLSFAEAVEKNTPTSRASRAQGGKLGTFKPGELKEDIAAAISTLKPGEITEPIRLQDGYQIVRVDARTEPTLRPFDDPEVQQAIGRVIMAERGEDARKKYIKRLRDEAFIEINKSYAVNQAKADK
ncbi:MAG TPA: peptidyl-prolyl cis-trans isomerase [Blastocatellia bacterium]|nr:peptidyl-prolyl cis-trans isomerase [Blastocatellia bacterium]